MSSDTKDDGEHIELEKRYGKVACKGLLNAAEFSRKSKNEPISKGYASQTGAKRPAKGMPPTPDTTD
jgi:hypothetical protein